VLEGLPDDAWRWLQRSLDGSREVGDQLGKAYALCELGRLAHIAGDHMASLSRHLDALREAEEAGDLHCVVECLEGVAAVEIALGEAAQGVTLCSAAAAWRRRHGVPPTPSRRGELDRTLASARAALSHAAFTIAWDDGQRSDLYAAIDLAHSERSRHGEPAADDPATRAR
jgi:hypothetical protein